MPLNTRGASSHGGFAFRSGGRNRRGSGSIELTPMDQRELRTVVLGYRRIRGWKMKDSKMTDQLQRLNHESVLCREGRRAVGVYVDKGALSSGGPGLEGGWSYRSSANRKGHSPGGAETRPSISSAELSLRRRAGLWAAEGDETQLATLLPCDGWVLHGEGVCLLICAQSALSSPLVEGRSGRGRALPPRVAGDLLWDCFHLPLT